MSLRESLEQLEARIAEAKTWVAQQGSWETAYAMMKAAREEADALREDNARLRGLLKDIEWDSSPVSIRNGQWMAQPKDPALCILCDAHHGEPHRDDCRGFTPDGVVK